jgi:hypothetical protein
VKSIEKLIVVAGHAALRDDIESCPSDPSRDEHWVLQSFQHGEPPYYIEHIKKGVELLQKDSSSLLLFSGGRTRKEAGHWSEAASYGAVAEHFGHWSESPHRLRDRTALEEYARDSFQNLEYGLYRFYQLEGFYPRHITVVGWRFKAERFDLHRRALGIPSECFTYVGANDPADLVGALKGEERAVEQFRADPAGNQSPLAAKRIERNPFNETSPYNSCPPIRLPVSTIADEGS